MSNQDHRLRVTTRSSGRRWNSRSGLVSMPGLQLSRRIRHVFDGQVPRAGPFTLASGATRTPAGQHERLPRPERDLRPLSSRPCDEAVKGWGETDRELSGFAWTRQPARRALEALGSVVSGRGAPCGRTTARKDGVGILPATTHVPAYRWNEDGLAGICDATRPSASLALWNGRTPSSRNARSADGH
jgi:hypothetical protein